MRHLLGLFRRAVLDMVEWAFAEAHTRRDGHVLDAPLTLGGCLWRAAPSLPPIASPPSSYGSKLSGALQTS